MCRAIFIWYHLGARSEKIFLILLSIVLLIVAIMTIVIGVLSWKTKYCTNVECLEQSIKMQSYRTTESPCTYAYRFTCGNSQNFASNDENFSFLERQTIKLMQACSLPVENSDHTFIKLTKKLYQTCVNTTDASKNSLISIVRAVTLAAGGWPVLQGNEWNEKLFDWRNSTYTFRKLGYVDDLFIEVGVNRNDKHQNNFVLEVLLSDFEDYHYGVVDIDTTDVMVELATIFGAENSQKVVLELKDAHIFQKKLQELAKYRKIKGQSDILTSFYEYQDDCESFNWFEVASNIIGPKLKIKKTQIALFSPPDVFKQFLDLISITPKRVQANYMMWRFVEKYLPYIYPELLYHKLGFNKQQKREEFCLDTIKNMGLLYQAQTIVHQKEVTHAAISEITDILDAVKDELVNTLRVSKRFYSQKKQDVLDKISSVKFVISPMPDFAIDVLFKKSLVEKINLDHSSLLKLLAQANKNFRTLEFLKLKSDGNLYMRKIDISLPHYNPHNHAIEAMGLATGGYYDQKRPQYINYATIGTMMSRAFGELLLGQNDTKVLVNSLGTCVFGDNRSKEAIFVAAYLAIIQQVTYNAYMKWIAKHGTELPLSNVNSYYHPNAAFWWASFSTFCKPKNFHALYEKILLKPEYMVYKASQYHEPYLKDHSCHAYMVRVRPYKCKTL